MKKKKLKIHVNQLKYILQRPKHLEPPKPKHPSVENKTICENGNCDVFEDIDSSRKKMPPNQQQYEDRIVQNIEQEVYAQREGLDPQINDNWCSVNMRNILPHRSRSSSIT